MSVPNLRLLSAIKIAQEFFNDHRVDQLCWSHYSEDDHSEEKLAASLAELGAFMRHKTQSLTLPKSLKADLLCIAEQLWVQYDTFLSLMTTTFTRHYCIFRPKKWTKLGSICCLTILGDENQIVEMFDRISDFEEKVVWFHEICWTCKESVIKSLWESLTRNEQNQVISECLDWEIEYDWCPYWLNQFADDSMKTELANTYLDCLGQIGFLASGINFHAFWHSVHCFRLDAAIFFYDKLTPEEKSIHCPDHATCSHLFVHVFRNLTENCFPFAWRILQLPCLPVKIEILIRCIPPGMYDEFLDFALDELACWQLILKIRCQIIETLIFLAPDGENRTSLLAHYSRVGKMMILYMFGSDDPVRKIRALVQDDEIKEMAAQSLKYCIYFRQLFKWQTSLKYSTISRTQLKEIVEMILPDDVTHDRQITLKKILSWYEKYRAV